MKPLILALVVSLLLSVPLRPIAGERRHIQQTPKYRVADKWRGVGESVLLLKISIKKKHANQDDLLALAQRLSADFSREQEVLIWILDDHEAAKSFVEGRLIHHLNWERDRKALKAFYKFKRASKEHYIELFLDPNDVNKLQGNKDPPG